MTRNFAWLIVAVALAGALAGCGRYGPPEPYPPEPEEARDDEEQRR